MNFICLGSEIERNKHRLDGGADERKNEAKKNQKKQAKHNTRTQQNTHIALLRFRSMVFSLSLSLSPITCSASNYIVIRVVKHLLLDLIALLQCSFKRYLRCTFISLCVRFFSSPPFATGDCETEYTLYTEYMCLRDFFLFTSSASSFYSCFVSFYPLQSMAFRSFIPPLNQFDWDFVCSLLLLDSKRYWFRVVQYTYVLCLCVCARALFLLVLHKRLTFKVMHCFA